MAANRGITKHSSGMTSSPISSHSQYSIQETIKIYTEWANHYLEKAKCQKRVENLQSDLSDGVLLSYIVQSVTNSTLDGINYNPRNSTQMLSNITRCIKYLEELGVLIEDLTAADIKEGNLKCVLGLFFNLSRYKQQQKQASQQQKQGTQLQGMSSKIPPSGIRAPSSSHKQLSTPGLANGKSIPTASANKKSGLIPPGQRQSNGSTISSRSSSPTPGYSVSPTTTTTSTTTNTTTSSKIGLGNGRSGARKTGLENSNSNNSISANSGMSSKSNNSATSAPGKLSSLPSNSNQASSLPSNVPAQSPGMLDKLFKSKKTSTSSKSRPDDKSGSKAAVVTKKEKISSKTSKKEESKISKPPLSSSIPRGGSISSRSRTPSRENLAKCRIQAPSAVGKATNRLSSDSGIHSPAEGKPESRESALVRNNSLPSSRVLSTKDSALSRQTALRASTNSPVTSKKERTLPKALSYSSKPASSSVDKQRPEGNSENSSSNVRLKIPPPLPSSLPPSSLPASSIQPPATSNLPSSSGKPPPAYQHTSGISQPLRPHSASSKISTSVSNSPYQSKDDINQAKKLQQQAMQAGHRAKTESNTQTDTSALQRIARKTESRKSPPKEISSGAQISSGSGAQTPLAQTSSFHILPGQKSSQARIMALKGRSRVHSGADSSSSSLSQHNTTCSNTDSVVCRPESDRVESSESNKLKANEKADDSNEDFQVKPMQPLDKLASFEFLQRLGRSGGAAPSQPHIKSSLSRFSQMNRSFNTKTSTRNIHEDYASDAECYANGYLSDAGTPYSRTGDYADYCSGYISEGGASVYARRMQQRFREGMQRVQECMKPSNKYPDVDDDSFDEDDASSVSSGDISDTLDLVDTAEDSPTNHNSGVFFNTDLKCLAAPYRPGQGQISCTQSDMMEKNGVRVPLSLRSTANGYLSDSGCNYSITEKCLVEQQRAKGLISSKTQQSLANKPDDLYKYHTLGRSRNLSAVDPRSYAYMASDMSVSGLSDNASPVWVMRSATSDTASRGPSGGPSRSFSSARGTQSKHCPSRTLATHYQLSHGHNSMLPGSAAASLYSHVHQGGYESDSGVVERKSLCSQCCQPINKDHPDVRGSQISLNSTSSSMYSTADERNSAETHKLRRELEQAKEQVYTLTNQLTTNAHVVQAFEQSLGNMTARLQQLQSRSEQKDSELTDMKSTIDNLRRMTGLAHTEILQTSQNQALNLHSSVGHHGLERQMSADSINSLNSMSSMGSGISTSTEARKKAKKNWIRNSFSKAFGGKKKSTSGSISDVEGENPMHYAELSAASAPTTPTHNVGSRNSVPGLSVVNNIYTDCDELSPEAIAEMKRLLREKDMKLTDIRLDALTSAHQLEQLRDAMGRMKQEMSYLKADNDRLHRMVGDTSSSSLPLMPPSSPLSAGASISGGMSLLSTSFSQTTSPTSLTSPVQRAFGASGDRSGLDFLSNHSMSESDNGKRVTVSVVPEDSRLNPNCLIGSLSVTGKTKWDVLDSLVKRTFKQYLSRIDQSTNLGLTSESIYAYIVGEVYRTKDGESPELLPYGYLVGDTTNIKIVLKGATHNTVDTLAFETGIPKSIIQRYASLLSEHRRIILSGPRGTGKSHLAQHLASYLIARSGKPRLPQSVATFDGEHKSSSELREYLCSIQEQCESSDMELLPTAIILDNLHHVSSLGDVFSGFLSHKSAKCPYIIGTMNQTTNATTNLQLHHNFRWILCANHMEPVKGFLGRYLRRKLVSSEVSDNTLNNDLGKIIEWIPKVWQHLNKFIETHHSSDSTIGPRQFLDCPMDISSSQTWFTQLWNFSLVPYLKEAIKEGLQKYGQKSAWEDPTDWLIQTYPWCLDSADLIHLRAEDVGYDKHQTNCTSPLSAKQTSSCGKEGGKESGGRDVDPGDPLYNMILRLREASYSSTQTDSSNNVDPTSSAILDTV